jgi:hypothetical protein
MATKNTQAISPVGKTLWATLNKPDTKFNEAGIYSVKLQFTGDDAQKLSAFLDTKLQESIAEAKKENVGKKIKEASAPYEWTDDNTIVVNFKMKASGIGKSGMSWSRKPALFDAKGKPLVGEVRVGQGSLLAVSYEPSLFYTSLIGAGVSLRLNAVQIVKLVEYTGGPDNPGFGEHEGGYEVEEESTTPFTPKAEGKSTDAVDF